LRVTAREHPALYRLLEALRGRTGVPLVVIEPLADSEGRPARHPAAAYGLLRAGLMDALVVGNSVILNIEDLPELPAPVESGPRRVRRAVGQWMERHAGRALGLLGRVRRASGQAIAWTRRMALRMRLLAASGWPYRSPPLSYWRTPKRTPQAPLSPLALPPPD
jgi:hypothetical protein